MPVVHRYVEAGAAEERRKRLVALLASGLERLLRKDAQKGLAIPPNLSAYTYDRPEGREEDEPWS